ncbi:MAG: TetR/AcrR family transcriptional regulator [Propioniciclava sp.]|uniref:TetR/AcrR family transcriptional regulator n=1 Tax=Propioniciclava sp. TaxID=2038686 RepID=UPI0039E5BAFB
MTKKRARRGPYSKSAGRREEIVHAAFEVFAARGYLSGSLQEIADRLGRSQTGLLHYFPSKQALLLAVLAERDVSAKPATAQADPHDLLAEVLNQARHNEQVPGLIELYTVLLGESVTEDHPAQGFFTDRFARLRASYARKLRALESQGRLRPGVDVDRAAASLVGLWDGLQTQWLLGAHEVDVSACLEDYLNGILLPAASS